jgi:hypothetical protein
MFTLVVYCEDRCVNYVCAVCAVCVWCVDIIMCVHAGGQRSVSVQPFFAVDAPKFTHEELVLQATSPTVDTHIVGLTPLLQAVPHFDFIQSINDPVAHTLNHGIADTLLDAIFANGAAKKMKPWRVANTHRAELESRVRVVQTVDDVSRPLKRLTEARSHWSYDDSAWFFCVYLPLIGLYQFIEAEWMRDCLWYCARMIQHAWFLYHPGMTYAESLDSAQDCAEKFGAAVESNKLYDLCTSNLHSLVCHMFKSEKFCGPIARRRDLGIERFIGFLKYGVVNKVTFMPEKTQGRNYIISQAVLECEDFALMNNIPLPKGSITESGSHCFDHTGHTSLTNPIAYEEEDRVQLVNTLAELLGSSAANAPASFHGSCNHGGQVLHYNSKYTPKHKRRSSYFGMKDLKTFGVVTCFVSLPDTPPIVIFEKLNWLGTEFYDQVHLLEIPGESERVAAYVSQILGRVAVVKVDASAPNNIRAVFIPKFVNNNLN